MSAKRTIKAKEVVFDIRSGMTNRQLMDKYKVSVNSLHNLLRKLVDFKALQISEVQALLSSIPEESAFKEIRKEPRNYVFVPLPIYDVNNLLDEGQVMDLSEGGLRTSGLEAKIGEKREFLIQADYFAHVFPFCFEAECRWVSQTEEEPWFAGFQITSISEGGLVELRKIIRMLTITG
jgi:hypothetical protein